MSLFLRSHAPDLTGYRAALEELRRTYDKIYAGLDTTDAKLQALLSTAGLLIAIAATLQVAVLRSKGGIWFWVALAGAFVVFAAMFALVLWAVSPRAVQFPIPRTWDEISIRYFGEPERLVIKCLISDYLDVLDKVGEFTDFKARCLRWAMVLFLAMIIALLIALWFSMR